MSEKSSLVKNWRKFATTKPNLGEYSISRIFDCTKEVATQTDRGCRFSYEIGLRHR